MLFLIRAALEGYPKRSTDYASISQGTPGKVWFKVVTMQPKAKLATLLVILILPYAEANRYPFSMAFLKVFFCV